MSVILKSPAYLIRRFPHSESSLILHAFTRSYGRKTLIAKGARRASSKFLGHLEPFQQLELVFYQNDSRQIQTLSDTTILDPFPEIHKSVQKFSLASWVLELLNRTLPEDDPHPDLFDAVTFTFQGLAHTESKELNYIVKLIILLFQESGFQLDLEKCGICKRGLSEEETVFNIPAGQLICNKCGTRPVSGRVLKPIETLYLKNISEGSYSTVEKISIPRQFHSEMMQHLIHYMNYHFDSFKKFNSVDLWYQSQT